MATNNLQFLTGNSSARLTDTTHVNYPDINPGSVYFTTDGKIYFDLNSETRICMTDNVDLAKTATAFSSGRIIRLEGAITGATESDGLNGWTINTQYNITNSPFILKEGDTANGIIKLNGGSDTDSLLTGALDLLNHNITNVNGIYIDPYNYSPNDGIHFVRTKNGTEIETVDTLYANNGTLYFANNRAKDDKGTGHIVLTTNNYTGYAAKVDGSNVAGSTWNISVQGSAQNLSAQGEAIEGWPSGNYLSYFSSTTNSVDKRAIFMQSVNNSSIYALLLSKDMTDTEATPTLNIYDYNTNTLYPIGGEQDSTNIALSALKLKTPRLINGTYFDGSQNIQTANWGPNVIFQIVNPSTTASTIGTAVEVNGSTRVSLELPGIISSNLSGTAASADKLTCGDIGGVEKAVHFEKGIPVVSNQLLDHDIKGNAATASLASALVTHEIQVGKIVKDYYGQSISFTLDEIGAIGNDGEQILNGTLTLTGGLKGNAATASLAYTMGDTSNKTYNIGNEKQPIYFAEGIPTVCGTELNVNAATASAWKNALDIQIGSTIKSINAGSQITWSFADITGDAEASGIPALVSGTIPSKYLPSYIDDVRLGEYDAENDKFTQVDDEGHKFPMIESSGIIYVDTNTNRSYRWNGVGYTMISNPIVIGSVEGTALDAGVGMSHINDTITNPHGINSNMINALSTIDEIDQSVRSNVNFAQEVTANSFAIMRNFDKALLIEKLDDIGFSNLISITAPSGQIAFGLSNNKVENNYQMFIDGNGVRPGADGLYDLGYAGNDWTGVIPDWTPNFNVLPSTADTTKRLWKNIFAKKVYASNFYGLSEKATRLADYSLYGTNSSQASELQLIYFEEGLPHNSDTSIGFEDAENQEIKPVYVQHGKIKPFAANMCANGISLLTMVEGVFKKSIASVGGPILDGATGEIITNDRAVYLKDGEIIACNDTLMHNISGNAATASKFKNVIQINDTDFDGSATITTNKWGASREIGIVNSDGTGNYIKVSVDGSGDINLKLPATIKATLDGNASSASILETARTVQLTGSVTGSAEFNGSKNLIIETTTNHNHDDRYILIGGNAVGAERLIDTNGSALSVGTSTLPVYFSEGIPVVCDNVFQEKHKTVSVSLPQSGWNSSTNTQVVNVTGVTSSNTVIIRPNPSYHMSYIESNVRATAQGNGTLTFTCEDIPQLSLQVNLLIFN